jgi:ribonuclease HI
LWGGRRSEGGGGPAARRGGAPPPPPRRAPEDGAAGRSARPEPPESDRGAPEPAESDDGPVGDDVPALAGLAVHAYTDGAASGNPGPAGIGVVLIFREHRKELSKYLGETTNNVAELTAVLEALRLVKRRDLPVRVHVDSSYAIGVANGSMRPKANRELVALIHEEMRGFSDLVFVKVPGHSGVEANERADALARDAVRKHRPR